MSESRAATTLLDFGTALGCGLLAALVGAGPAALRLSSSDAGDAGVHGLLLLAACAIPFTTLAVLVFRQAHTGLRAMIGKPDTASEQRGFVRTFVSLWLLSFSPLLFVLGSVLRDKTHHRPLAGATFALVGLVLLLGSAFVSHRLARLLDRLRERQASLHSALTFALYAMVVVMLLLAARKLHAKLPVESAATMIDTTALVLAAALAARPELRTIRLLGAVGPLAAAFVLVLGLTRVPPDLVHLTTERAPAFAALLHALRLD